VVALTLENSYALLLHRGRQGRNHVRDDVADLQELLAAVNYAAAAENSNYRIRRLSRDLAAAQKSAAESLRSFADHLLRELAGDQ
jgi:hypothetical protein